MPALERTALEAVLALLEGHTDRREERRILEILASCSAEELDAIVGSPHIDPLIAAVDDRLVGPDHRAELLRLLTERRVAELGMPSRAALVRALARGRTSAQDEQHVRALFLATRGAALTALKEAVEASEDYHDLVQLVFHDVDDEGIRSSILEHFAACASAPAAIKILSDLDDTLYVNWRDKRYPPKTVYPGVRQLYAELSGSPDNPGAAVVTFVTARPSDRLGLFEGATRESLSQRGLPRARVLTGSFTNLLTNESIAEGKVDNFIRYRKVFPEFKFLFFGDSGQGDVLFGERMLELAREVVPAVFIHDVVSTPPDRREALRARGVHLFDTYVGAAAVARELGLLSAEGLLRVVSAAERELAAVPFESEEARLARGAELARDAARARSCCL